MDVAIAHNYTSALALLRGSRPNYALCWISTGTSLLWAAVGILAMTEDGGKRVMSAQSILFLVAQSFTLTRASRDWSFFKPHDIAKPTPAYMAQVIIFFVVALALSAYGVTTSAASAEWRGFLFSTLTWATVSALCLSKAVRDRSDAVRSAALPVDQHAKRLEEILHISMGTIEYQILVWLSAMFSVVMTLGFMWTWDEDTLAIERKGFLTVCILWCEGSSFHLAKLVRDRADQEKAAELQGQLPYQALVVLSSVLSALILILGVCIMPLPEAKRFFLLAGCCFILSSAFFLAKHVRDRLEARVIAARVGKEAAAAPDAVAPDVEAAGDFLASGVPSSDE